MTEKILIIDDDKDLIETTEDILIANGYDVVVSHNGKNGLDKVKSEAPTLILLDVTLPGGMDGHEVCEKIKTDASTENIPVIMITGRHLWDDEEKSERRADFYITKPYDIAYLLKNIRKLIEKSTGS